MVSFFCPVNFLAYCDIVWTMCRCNGNGFNVDDYKIEIACWPDIQFVVFVFGLFLKFIDSEFKFFLCCTYVYLTWIICDSVIVEALKVDSLQRLCSSLEPILRRVVSRVWLVLRRETNKNLVCYIISMLYNYLVM